MRKLSMSREEFKTAFREVVSSEFAYIPTDEDSIDFTFSEKFIKRMDKLIRAQKKSYYKFINTAGKRVAVIFAAIITLFTASLSVKAIREPVVKFFTEVYESFTRYIFEGDTTDTINKEYSIKVLPDGFEQTSVIKGDTIVTKIYENKNGDKIKFTQQTTNNANHTFDNENGKVTKISLNDINIDIYETDGIMHALWTEYGYYFKLSYYGNTEIENFKAIIKTIE